MGYLFRRERRHSIFQASNDKGSESMDLLTEKLIDYAAEPSRDIRRSDPTHAASVQAKENHEAEPAAQVRRHTVSHSSVRDGWQHFEWATGDKYDGNLKNQKKHGFGIMKWSNGDEYQGIWNMDKREDIRGRYNYSHGAVYEGGFQNDRRHGEGILTYPNGDKFVGTWVKGGRCGKGILYTSNGFEIEQQWNESSNVNYSASMPPKFPEGALVPKFL